MGFLSSLERKVLSFPQDTLTKNNTPKTLINSENRIVLIVSQISYHTSPFPDLDVSVNDVFYILNSKVSGGIHALYVFACSV